MTNFLKQKEIPIIYASGETILGVPRAELGTEFVNEFEHVINSFESYLQKDVHTLFILLNSRILALFFVGTLTPFSRMPQYKRDKYLKKMMLSKIPLFRTAYSTIKALCGWSYYSLKKTWEELDFPGETIGREHLTPTLLKGKKPWEEMKKEGLL